MEGSVYLEAHNRSIRIQHPNGNGEIVSYSVTPRTEEYVDKNVISEQIGEYLQVARHGKTNVKTDNYCKDLQGQQRWKSMIVAIPESVFFELEHVSSSCYETANASSTSKLDSSKGKASESVDCQENNLRLFEIEYVGDCYKNMQDEISNVFGTPILDCFNAETNENRDVHEKTPIPNYVDKYPQNTQATKKANISNITSQLSCSQTYAQTLVGIENLFIKGHEKVNGFDTPTLQCAAEPYADNTYTNLHGQGRNYLMVLSKMMSDRNKADDTNFLASTTPQLGYFRAQSTIGSENMQVHGHQRTNNLATSTPQLHEVAYADNIYVNLYEQHGKAPMVPATLLPDDPKVQTHAQPVVGTEHLNVHSYGRTNGSYFSAASTSQVTPGSVAAIVPVTNQSGCSKARHFHQSCKNNKGNKGATRRTIHEPDCPNADHADYLVPLMLQQRVETCIKNSCNNPNVYKPSRPYSLYPSCDQIQRPSQNASMLDGQRKLYSRIPANNEQGRNTATHPVTLQRETYVDNVNIHRQNGNMTVVLGNSSFKEHNVNKGKENIKKSSGLIQQRGSSKGKPCVQSIVGRANLHGTSQPEAFVHSVVRNEGMHIQQQYHQHNSAATTFQNMYVYEQNSSYNSNSAQATESNPNVYKPSRPYSIISDQIQRPSQNASMLDRQRKLYSWIPANNEQGRNRTTNPAILQQDVYVDNVNIHRQNRNMTVVLGNSSFKEHNVNKGKEDIKKSSGLIQQRGSSKGKPCVQSIVGRANLYGTSPEAFVHSVVENEGMHIQQQYNQHNSAATIFQYRTEPSVGNFGKNKCVYEQNSSYNSSSAQATKSNLNVGMENENRILDLDLELAKQYVMDYYYTNEDKLNVCSDPTIFQAGCYNTVVEIGEKQVSSSQASTSASSKKRNRERNTKAELNPSGQKKTTNKQTGPKKSKSRGRTSVNFTPELSRKTRTKIAQSNPTLENVPGINAQLAVSSRSNASGRSDLQPAYRSVVVNISKAPDKCTLQGSSTAHQPVVDGNSRAPSTFDELVDMKDIVLDSNPVTCSIDEVLKIELDFNENIDFDWALM